MSNLAQAVKVSIEIHEKKTELDSIPARVREIQEELNAIEENYLKKKQEHDQFETQRKELEQAILVENENLEQKENRLNSIKTQKEYQAVVSEITQAKTHNREREVKLGELQSGLEGLVETLKPLEEKVGNLKGQLTKEKSNIQGTLDELESQVKKLETQLGEQLSSLPEDIREKYQKIQLQKQPPAALVSHGTCQACFMALPPQLFIEIQKAHKVHSCPNCFRLLYLDE